MKRFASVIFAICFTLSLLTLSAFAADTSTVISDVAGLKAISESGTYTLTADLTLPEKVTLNLEGKDFTIDLAGKSITGQLVFTGEGKVTVKGGTLTSAVSAAVAPTDTTADDGVVAYAAATVAIGENATVILDTVTVSGKDYAIASKGNLTVKNATVNAEAVGIVFTGVAKGTVEKTVISAAKRGIATSNADGLADMEVVVSDTTITTTATNWNDCPIAWWGNGKLTVHSGTYKGGSGSAGIIIRNGDVTVNGGTFNAKDALKVDGSKAECVSMKLTVTDGTFNGTRAGLYHLGGNTKEVEINISGGTFKGGSSGALHAKSSDAKLTITGGFFDEEISAEYCAENHNAVLNTETGMYEIKAHIHTYDEDDWKYINIGFHDRVCTECGGGNETENHTWGEWQIGEDGTHSRVCSGCLYTIDEEHNWGDWIATDDTIHTKTCEKCDWTETEKHALTTVYDTADGSTHKATCSDCSHTVLSAHIYGEPQSLGNGAHVKQCTACNGKLTELCSKKDGVCEVCGDDVASGGCTAIVSSGLTAMIAVLGASAFVIRKKKTK